MIQNIGRDILKFHSVYFPYLLMASGNDKTPDDLVVHGFVNIEGQKMSKSKGNVVPIEALLSRFDKNAIRLYLLSKNIFTDFDFQVEELDEMSTMFVVYREEFASRIDGHNIITENAAFHENMVRWQYDQNIALFVRIMTEAENFNDLDNEDKDFLASFSRVFIV